MKKSTFFFEKTFSEKDFDKEKGCGILLFENRISDKLCGSNGASFPLLSQRRSPAPFYLRGHDLSENRFAIGATVKAIL